MKQRLSLTHVLVAGFLVVGLWIGTRLEPAVSAAAAPVPPLKVTELKGTVGSRARVAELTGETVVMLSSESCGYCKETLRELQKHANGKAASGLWVVNLEGATSADEMLRVAGIAGARALGPATSATQTLLTFQTPGTPVFAVLDSTGAIVRVLSGYPGREKMRDWFATMLREGA